MVTAAGIIPGWRVLDAGCGTGPFVPFLRQLVGEQGWVDALDASPDHVARVRRRAALEGWTRTTVLEGDLLAGVTERPPYDAVWCANVTQYLSDADLRTVLSGWRRAVRPSGLLVIKEFDVSGLRLDPLPEGLIDRWHAARCASCDHHALALDRTPHLESFMSEAGWSEVRSQAFRMIRVPSLRPVERTLVGELLRFLASPGGDPGCCRCRPARLAGFVAGGCPGSPHGASWIPLRGGAAAFHWAKSMTVDSWDRQSGFRVGLR